MKAKSRSSDLRCRVVLWWDINVWSSMIPLSSG